MEICLDPRAQPEVCDLLNRLNIPFRKSISLQRDIATCIHDGKTLHLFAIGRPQDFDAYVKRAIDKLLIIGKSESIIFYCVGAKEKLGPLYSEKLEKVKALIIEYGGYCPRSDLELGNFLKGKYCTEYRGCDSQCKKCPAFPANMLMDADNAEHDAWRSFLDSIFSLRHHFSFCE